ncbi:MAG: enoyl-CoA hydratase/isomerase family protein [Actinobacteria bacterium]|nr:MAG: enoyl-CoA hydratase/isomerase family protein [Actinomycetota bacterium]
MANGKVRTTLSDTGVRTIALDDPDKRNALSIELLDELIAALEEARDDATRCVVITSTHPKVFCAGGNLAAFGDDAPVIAKHVANDRFPTLFRHALAGGLGVALACDLIVARESASFGAPEINVGVFPFMLMALLYRNLPRKRVNELMLLGERVTAAEAHTIGFVNRVVPDGEDFDAAVSEWADRLAAKSPVLMRLGKDAMRRQDDMPYDDALDYLQSQLTLAFATQDAKEGLTAFLEKREPAWTGH